jgi:hypothetical protein
MPTTQSKYVEYCSWDASLVVTLLVTSDIDATTEVCNKNGVQLCPPTGGARDLPYMNVYLACLPGSRVVGLIVCGRVRTSSDEKQGDLRSCTSPSPRASSLRADFFLSARSTCIQYKAALCSSTQHCMPDGRITKHRSSYQVYEHSGEAVTCGQGARYTGPPSFAEELSRTGRSRRADTAH